MMRKTAIIFLVTILFSVLYSCGNGHSKVYVNLEKEVAVIEGKMQETATCDELQMLSFSILGLRSDLENACLDQSVSEAEADELTKEAMRLESVWMEKSASLGCSSQDEAEELVTSELDDYDY